MRRAIIREQQARGRKAVAVLPVHYPKPLLTAMDILAVELWGPPGPPRGPDAGRLQAYVCAVARNALAFLAAGHADVVDGVLFPHTCDSIQGLATLAPDFGGWGKPCFRYIQPKGEERPSSRAFVRAELESLAAELAVLTGKSLETAALRRALELHTEIDRLRAALLDGRARLAMTDRELYGLLRRGEFLWPEDHLQELKAATGRLAAEGSAPVQTDLPIMITGYVPEPMTLFDHLRAAGAYVAADDYAGIGRRVLRVPVGEDDVVSERSERSARPEAPPRPRPVSDPFVALVRQSFEAPPCSTRSANQDRRLEYLVGLYRRSRCAGLVVHVPKFCEPELFDVPAIRARFAAEGVPLLYLEGELEADLSAQAQTRIDAFCEMVAAQRRRGGRAAGGTRGGATGGTRSGATGGEA
ncbi:MAG: 2-hydroxyacyl-CoA dehydratase [Deltaproteobacteria bacterium]|nr:2-hydroxyacyl-CoA dehydratase [Deltaproteobacteria bacterium]